MPQIAIAALVILGYTLLAARLDRLSVSGPMILVTIGAVLGPSGVGAFAAPVTSESVQLLAELTLALLLFSDASSIGLKQAGSIAWVPARLLAIGLPLTIGAGALVGWLLFPALGLGFALLMGSILAPTDAALSLPLLVDRAIPVRVRRAINIESGLNDGIATPFVTLFLAVVVAEQASASQHWLIDAALEIALAIVVAIVVGGFGGRVIAQARRRGWATPASESLAVVSLAVLAYASATTIGGNGFVAAFAAGVFYRTATAAAEPSVEFADWIGVAGSYLVWLVFGIGFVGPVLAAGLDPVVLVYAVLSLTHGPDGPGGAIDGQIAASRRHGRAHRLVRAARSRIGGLPACRLRPDGSDSSSQSHARPCGDLDGAGVDLPPWVERRPDRRALRSANGDGADRRVGARRSRRAAAPPSADDAGASGGRHSREGVVTPRRRRRPQPGRSGASGTLRAGA